MIALLLPSTVFFGIRDLDVVLPPYAEHTLFVPRPKELQAVERYMAIPDLQVTAIRSEGREAWTVVTVEFQWLNGHYQGDGQWPDAVAAAALAMESEAWRAYWQHPHFVERELYDRGPMCLVAVERPESADAFSSWALNRRGGWRATAAEAAGTGFRLEPARSRMPTRVI